MIRTPICNLVGIEYPIFQGGMAWISEANLAAAVSNGGGLGIISAMNADARYLRQQITKTRELTDKPFGVNIMLMSPYADDVAEVVADERVPVVTTGAGNPAKYMESWLAADVKIVPVVASVAMAKLLSRAGATAIIAEGGESGGHVGDTTTMALVPQVCDVTDLPVIAAGGIGDGRGIAAAFMLGATGVQLGTRFLVADECAVHPSYKDKILKATDIATVVTGKKLGHPVRSLKTPFSRAYMKAEFDGTLEDEDLEAMGAGALRLAAVEGDAGKGCFLSGQIAGLVKKAQPAAEIIHEIFQEAESILSGADKWIVRTAFANSEFGIRNSE